MCDMSPLSVLSRFHQERVSLDFKKWTRQRGVIGEFLQPREVRGIKTGQEERREGRRSLGNCKCTNRKKETKACRRGI